MRGRRLFILAYCLNFAGTRLCVPEKWIQCHCGWRQQISRRSTEAKHRESLIVKLPPWPLMRARTSSTVSSLSVVPATWCPAPKFTGPGRSPGRGNMIFSSVVALQQLTEIRDVVPFFIWICTLCTQKKTKTLNGHNALL